jgi:hypothetical protein
MQSKGIHCKVSTQDQIRRFFLASTEYNVLAEQISRLFGFAKDSIVIKYVDDEGDKITISSTAELEFAIEISKATLRLTVDTLAVQPRHPKREERAKKWKKRHEKLDTPEAQNFKLSKLTQKQARLNSKMARLEALPPNHPARERIPRVQRKLMCISGRLQENQPKPETTQQTPIDSSDLPTRIDDLQKQVPSLRDACHQSRLHLKLQRCNFRAIEKGNRPHNYEELKSALEMAKRNESNQHAVMKNVLQLLKPLQHQHKLEKCRARAARKEMRQAAKMERKCKNGKKEQL